MESLAENLPVFDENDEPHYKDGEKAFNFSPPLRPHFDDNDNMYFTLEELNQIDQGN